MEKKWKKKWKKMEKKWKKWKKMPTQKPRQTYTNLDVISISPANFSMARCGELTTIMTNYTAT